MALSTRVKDADVNQAGVYLLRQLEQLLPGLYRRKYGELWAQEDSDVIMAMEGLDPGATSIIEQVIDERGTAVELSDNSDDIPMVEVSVGENKYNVHVITLGYKYNLMQLIRESNQGISINTEKARQVDRGIREKTHQLLLYGNTKRGTTGLFNNSEIPVTSSGYDANSSSFQDDVDFVAEELARVSNRNDMTDEISTMLIPENLWYRWTTRYQTNDTGKTVIQAIRDTLGASSGGPLQRIMRKNECRSDFLERFGVRPAGTNEDRIIFIPTAQDAVDRMFFSIDWLTPQLRGLHYYVYAYSATTQTMIHYPDACAYSDIPRVNPPSA